MIAQIYTFPFWMLIDDDRQPALRLINWKDHNIRIYPPFRTAPLNRLPMPHADGLKIPFLRNRAPSKGIPFRFVPLASIPVIGTREEHNQKMRLLFEDVWDGKPGKGFPMDSIRIDILGDADDHELELIGRNFISNFLDHLRISSRQWWITRSIDPLVGWQRASFSIDKYGCNTAAPYSYGKGRTLSNFEKPICRNIWDKSVQELQAKGPAPLYWLLYMDAKHLQAMDDFRGMVYEAASACELIKEMAFENWWKVQKGTPYRRGQLLTKSNLSNHLDKNFKNCFGSSLKEEKERTFEDIDKLWKARGQVAHGKHAFYYDKNQRVDIDITKARELMDSAYGCLKWVEKFIA